MIGDCPCARHLARAHGGHPRSQVRHPDHLFRGSSQKCQVSLRDRRPRQRHRRPSRTRSHSINHHCQWDAHYGRSRFTNACGHHALLFLTRGDGNQPQLAYRAQLSLTNGPGTARHCAAFSQHPWALLEPADECPERIWHRRIAEMIHRRLPCVRMAGCRLPFDTLVC